MKRHFSRRISKLENKVAGSRDHFSFVRTDAEALEARALFDAGPFGKLPGHRLIVIQSPLPPKDLRL